MCIENVGLGADRILETFQQGAVFVCCGCHTPSARHVGTGVGKRANQGDIAFALQGQQIVLVLQQYECLCGNLAGDGTVFGSEHFFFGTLHVTVFVRIGKQSQLVFGLQDASTGFVNVGFGHFAFFQRLFQCADKSVGYHVHVCSGGQGTCGYFLQVADSVVYHFGDGCIVCHHEAVEAPLVAQYVGQQPVVGSGGYSVNFIEGGHCATHTGFYGSLVGREVFVEHTVAAHIHRVVVAAGFSGAIQCEVLYASHYLVVGTHILALITANHGLCNG